MNASIEEGCWFRMPQLLPGIWRAYKVQSGFYEDRYSLDAPKVVSNRTILFGHRLFNSQGKRSFSHQSVEAAWVELLSEAELAQLHSNALSDPALMKAFEKYCAAHKKLDNIVNLAFGDLAPEEKEKFPEACQELLAGQIGNGLTLDAILALLNNSWVQTYRGKYPIMATLQLTCINCEVIEGDFVYREFRTLTR